MRTGEGAEAKPRTAMIRELSVSGAQILTQSRRDVGTRLSLSLFLAEGEPAREVEARVVRSEKREAGSVWPWLHAVEFAEPLQDLEPQIRAMAEKQSAVFGSKR